MPTEKIVYAVEEDPDNLTAQEAVPVDEPQMRTSYPTMLYSSAVTSIHSSSRLQKQATFVDRKIPSDLSTTAVRGHRGQIAARPRSKSESPRGARQKAQDLLFPQLKLNHIAPNFHALSSQGPIELYEYLSSPPKSLSDDAAAKAASLKARMEGNWLVFFSHPMDFTPVCTTEIASMAKLQNEFVKRGTKLLGLSIGTVQEHRQWMEEIRKIIEMGGTRSGGPLGAAKVTAVREAGFVQTIAGGGDGRVLYVGTTLGAGGVGALGEEKEMGMEDVVGSGSIGVTEKAAAEEEKGKRFLDFPIIADEDGFVAQLYGMLEDPEDLDPHTPERRSENLRTVRSLFIIDPHRRIRLMTSYPHTTGRNTAEVLRALDALQRSYYEGVMTPEGWTVGDEVVIPPDMSEEDAEKRYGKGGVRHVTDYLRYVQY